MRDARGFTVLEIIIAIVVAGLLATMAVRTFANHRQEAELSACLGDIEAFATDVQGLMIELKRAPTQDEVMGNTSWGTEFSEYWYLPNDSDHNKGHGNDLDGCDEENPGKSSKNRECIPMNWVIICNHNHGTKAKYVFKIDGGVPAYMVPISEDDTHHYFRAGNWWEGKDPNLQKWIGR